jgi:hypothetical protein
VVKIGDIIEVFPLDREYLPDRQEGLKRAKALRPAAVQYLRQFCGMPAESDGEFAISGFDQAPDDRGPLFPFPSPANEPPGQASNSTDSDLQDIPVSGQFPWERENYTANWEDQLW